MPPSASRYFRALRVSRAARRYAGSTRLESRPGDDSLKRDLGLIALPPLVSVADIGARRGAFSVLAAERLSRAQIHAFEPDPACLAALRRRIGSDGLTARVHVHASAPALSDAFECAQTERFDLVHVDVDGAEYEVLYRAPLALLARIDRFWIEGYPVAAGDPSYAPAALIGYLREHGFGAVRRRGARVLAFRSALAVELEVGEPD